MAGVLGKLRGRSFAEFRERLGQKLAAQLEVRGLSSDVRLLGDSALVSALALPRELRASNISESLHSHFASRSMPAFFRGIRDGSAAAEMRTPRWSAEAGALIAAADRILAGLE